MSDYSWNKTFMELFGRCLKRYQSGDQQYENYYTDADLAFLAQIGYQPREFFDFIEDCGDGGDPPPGTALLVAAARRDFFLVIQKGVTSDATLRPEDLPSRDATLGNYRWLPRIIAKARAKLRGELDPDIMYSCGGDRAFLKEHDIHPADFLRAVWAAGDDDEAVLAFVQAAASKAG